MFSNCLDPGAVLALHCPLCPLLTRNMMHFLTHCHMSHTERLEIALYQCSLCLAKCTHWEFLLEHIYADHPSTENIGIVEISQLSINSSRTVAPVVRAQNGQPANYNATNSNAQNLRNHRPIEAFNSTHRSTVSMDSVGCTRTFPQMRSAGLLVSQTMEDSGVQSTPSTSTTRLQPITVQIDKTTISMAHHNHHPRLSVSTDERSVACNNGAVLDPPNETVNVDLDQSIRSPRQQHSNQHPVVIGLPDTGSEASGSIKDESLIEWEEDCPDSSHLLQHKLAPELPLHTTNQSQHSTTAILSANPEVESVILNNPSNPEVLSNGRNISSPTLELEVDPSSGGDSLHDETTLRAMSLDQDRYHCTLCNQIFSESNDLKEHEKITHKLSVLTSAASESAMSSLTSQAADILREYRLKVAEQQSNVASIASPFQPLQLRCNQCSKTFPNAKALFCHRHFNHESSKKKRKKRQIFGVTKRKSRSQSVKDSSVEPSSQTLNISSMATRQKTSAALSTFLQPSIVTPNEESSTTSSQLISQETGQDRLQCSICNHIFHSKIAVSIHMGRVHKGVTSTPIDQIQPLVNQDEQEGTTSIQSKEKRRYIAAKRKNQNGKCVLLASHIKQPSLTTPQMCHHCGLQLENLARLIAHHSIVHRLRPPRCSYCDEIFSSSDSDLLAEHMREVHPQGEHSIKPSTPPSITQKVEPITISGRRIIHPDTPKMRYSIRPTQCPFCQKVFGKKPSLKIHMEEFHTDLLAYRKRVKKSSLQAGTALSAVEDVFDNES